MEQVFINLLNTSITAGYLVLAVLLLRPLLKKAPKFIRCILWGLVGLRLVLPFSLESVTSMIPNSQPIPPEIVYSARPAIESGFSILNSAVNPILSGSLAPVPGNSVNPMQIVMGIAWNVWVLGILILAVYSLVSFLVLRLKLREAVREDSSVWLCDRVSSPFLLGLFRPRIYLPSDLDAGDRTYVLAHENAHIRRKDHWWKPLGFLLLTVYWFNPLMWVAYIFLCRDIEFACDEKVIKELGETEKKPYSQALINCSVSKKMISACPVAFGEDGVKGRIQSVLNYKKPAFWVIVIAILLCIVVAVCFLTNPPQDKPDTAVHRFQATVVEIRDESLLVEPIDGETYFSGAEQVVVKLNGNDPSDYRLGCTVEIIFDGMVQELYPPIVPNASSIVNMDSMSSTIVQPKPDHSFVATVTEIGNDHVIVKYRTFPLHNLEYRYYQVNTDPGSYTVGDVLRIHYSGFVTDAEPYGIMETVYQVEVVSQGGTPVENDGVLSATVLEVRKDALLVEPHEGEFERTISDKFVVMLENPTDYQVNRQLAIYYNGVIGVSTPPAITAFHVEDGDGRLLHTVPEKRQADRFMIQATEYANTIEYRICYREPDGCLTEVTFIGHHEQPLMICNDHIYYIENEIINAINFSGKTVATITLPQGYYQGSLLYCDGKNIYGASGDKGMYCFCVDLDLTAYTELSAIPAQYRKLDTKKLTADIAFAMKYNHQDIRVHKGNIIYDSNGMVTSMLLAVSAEHNGKYQAGNIVFSWYNNQKSYDEAIGNPWFNPTDAVYEPTLSDMTLADFLNYVTNLKTSDMIKGETPDEFSYRFYFNGGISPLDNPEPIYDPPKFDVLKTYPVVVYAYQLGKNSWRFILYEDTSISGSMSSSVMYGFDGIDAQHAKKELAAYGLPPSEIPVIVINSYISSCLYEITEETTQEARRALGLL